MQIPVENVLAFFPQPRVAGNVTLHPITLSGLARIGAAGVDIARTVPDDKLFEVAWILAGEEDYNRFLKRCRVGLQELRNAVESVLNDAFATFVKPAQASGGTIHLTPHGIGMPLEYAEFLCAEYGWSWETAINTPVVTVLALVVANRHRHGGKFAGFDYIEKHYAASLKRTHAVDKRKEEAV